MGLCLRRVRILWAGLLILLLTNRAYPAENWEVPRTEYGQPDFQGVWYYGSATPMERPVSLGNKMSYSEQESAQLIADLNAAEAQKAAPLDPSRQPPETGATIAQEADHNFATMRTNLVTIDGLLRTSQIVEPDSGQFPYRDGYQDFYMALLSQGNGAFDGPEIRSVSERCVAPTGGPLPPIIGWFYNANMQIYQTRDYVVLNAEMTHDARIIPLTDQSPQREFPQWMGHSTGHWQGDTLVIETSGFRPEQSWWAFRMSEQLRVEERITMVNANELIYRARVEDPGIYSDPFVVEKNIVRRPDGEHLFEYSCHEGNYAMSSILAGARRQELETEFQQK